MNDYLEITTEIPLEWKDTFTDTALSYLKSAHEKAYFSVLDMNAYYYVKAASSESYSAWNRQLFSEGTISGFPVTGVQVDMYNGSLPADLLLSKINLNFFNTIHGFFDTYGHFLHVALFPGSNVPKNLYLSTVKQKIDGYPTMSSISDALRKLTSQYIYSYINDLDNTNKHRDHISPILTTWLDNGEQTIEVPPFDKDGREHYDYYMEDAFEESCKLVIDCFNDVTAEVLTYLNRSRS
ncbi:hypothetical protein [Candidatus Pristimantibacillus sp. PTI5]|uniref:hypothetical protein n=1 Tax=Candidatus Pristimantibacillus sp. PTI5 TaxID=3400422 RepID=UPI003B018324